VSQVVRTLRVTAVTSGRNRGLGIGARLVQANRVRLVLCLLVIGCHSASTHQTPDAPPDALYSNDCSWRDMTFGASTCTEDPSGNGFYCTCDTAGATCTYENWENGCSCSCMMTSKGLYWSCIPDEPFSPPCPSFPPP